MVLNRSIAEPLKNFSGAASLSIICLIKQLIATRGVTKMFFFQGAEKEL
jgi:hypothetical protein